MTILVFEPNAAKDAKANLQDWIEFAKANQPFGPEFDWDANCWDLTKHLKRRSSANLRTNLYFTSVQEVRGSRKSGDTPFPDVLRDVAKAVVSEKHRTSPVVEYDPYIDAFRALTPVVIEAKLVSLTDLTREQLNVAARSLARRKDPSKALGKIKVIADLLDQKRLVSRPLQWAIPKQPGKPVPVPRMDRAEIDPDWKHSKLPELGAIFALAQIHRESQDPIDRVVTSWCGLALFAPSRRAEIDSLPVNCWTEISGEDGEKAAMRAWPAKGALPMTKMAPSEDSLQLARDAVDYLVRIGADARVAARWYADHPTELYLPPEYEALRGQPLTVKEIGGILGWEKASASSLHNLEITSVGKTVDRARKGSGTYAALYLFADVERVVIERLPSTFPIMDQATGLLMHDALMVIPWGFLRPDMKGGWRKVPQPITHSMLYHQLGANPNGRTVFSRNGKMDPQGKPWKLTSHMFRHLLNTIAQGKHLPQALIALWSGRADVKQNAAYDHTDPEVYIERYLLLASEAEELPLMGPLAETVEVRRKTGNATMKAILREEIGAVHATKYGLCRHHYALTPCPRTKDCIRCGENMFVKGDPKNMKEAQRQVRVLGSAVTTAKNDLAAGEDGAAKWLEVNEPRFRRWRAVLDIHQDESIVDGTLCTLPPMEDVHSATGLAVSLRAEAEIDPSESLLDKMEGLDI